MGKVFTHFSKPGRRFVEDCLYGIQASGDTKLSSIVRAIDDDIRPIYTEKRLSRNLDDEVLKIVKAVYAATEGKGVAVYDRGGDRPAFYDYLIGEGHDFVVRLKGRSVLSWGGMHEVHDLARQCTMRHSHHVTFDSHGKECNVPTSFGAMPVRLPTHPEKELHLVVVKGFDRIR